MLGEIEFLKRRLVLVSSIGIDMVKTARVEKNLARFGNRLADKILGLDEKELLAKRIDKSSFLAGRFAAKEALIKALGKFLKKKPMWKELQVLNSISGQPIVKFSSRLLELLSDNNFLISITHEREYALAMVVVSEGK